ncbi:DUF3426 domain-containing protein [Lysobacter sp. SG-8]|uniref:DUF3426 domain-containing protein n=1 Tax=Marilutibacter penaei TaxID=2759900 RepID=A0A7W3U111_9GAMM|nr:DUF3426 domain-containing protein [Lysobacter penaei]MBB1086934.1 DUF3426 domain-containing protein [Lysobacter penaei]
MTDDTAPESTPVPHGDPVSGSAPDAPAAAPDRVAPPSAEAPPPPDSRSSAPPPRRGGPSFTRVRIDPLATSPRWPAWLALGTLALLLALQLLLAQRAELAARAGWRPLLLATCTVFRCTLPPWHEPEAFTMLDRSVRPVPGQPGLLRINASFRNDARWPQAWPTLVLSLSDADGRQAGQRAFKPDEYRPGEAQGTLAPEQSTTVAFEVVEPAAHIVAYTFEFR